MTPWPEVRLREVLTKSESWIRLDPETEYKEVRACLWGKGLELRRIVAGSEIASSRRLEVRADQFLISRIDARHGAAGLVPEVLDGAVVTNDYPAFDIDKRRLLPKYLGWYAKTTAFVDACRHASEGTTNRVRLQEQKFLDFTMPLPPIEEQQRSVQRIEAVSTAAGVAKRLREEVADKAEALCRSIVINDEDATLTPLRQLLRLRIPDVEVQARETYTFAGVFSFGRGVFVGDTKTGLEFTYPRLTTLRTGDFVYPKLMAWEGAFGVVPEECDGCVVSTEFPVFEIDETKVLREVLDTYFRIPSVWPDIAGLSTGTNVRRRRLKPQDLLAYELPLPSTRAQHMLRAVRSQTAVLKRLQSQTSREFDALMPSALNSML